MSYLKKRHNTWYARLSIPSDARETLGRTEFVQSLKTQSKATAQSRAITLICEWKEAIANALSLDPIKSEALWWWSIYKTETDHSKVEQVLTALYERTDNLARKEGHTEAIEFHNIATGKALLLSTHLESWYQHRLKETSEEGSTNKQRVTRMIDRCRLSNNVH